MKVQGNVSPNAISIENYRPIAGYVEVRVRENINDVIVTDDFSGSVTMYEYDEYIFHIPNRDGLQAEIEANMNEWLLSGRCKEVDSNASAMADALSAVDELLDTIGGAV